MMPWGRLIVGTDHGKSHIKDKSVDGQVCTLKADGSTTLWLGPRVECDILYLEGDDALIAAWLTEIRNRNTQLSRAHGWYLIHLFVEVKDRPNAVHAFVYWMDIVESMAAMAAWEERTGETYPWPFIGPLKDLGLVFLDWRADCRQRKVEKQDELLRLLEAKAHAELTAQVDAQVFEDIRHATEVAT